MNTISTVVNKYQKVLFTMLLSFTLFSANAQMATKSFYFSNTPNDAIVLDSVKAFIKQSDLVCDCNSQESILSSAISMSVSGSCIYGSVGNTGCSNSLEYLWMKCNVDGTNCSEQTGWISGGSGSLCPSTAGWYTFCVRFAGCYSTNVGEVPLQYVGGGGGGGCNVSASISGTTTFCVGSTTTLTATGSGSSGYSYRWTTGSSSRSITVSSGGYYGVTVTDANGCTADAGVQVTAQSCTVNHAPTCSSVSASTCGTTAVTGNFLGSDVDGDALTYTIVTQPSSGSVTKSGSKFTYTPAGTSGVFSFTYRVSDGSLTSSTCTVSITITSCNNAPTCNPVSVSTCLGTAVTGNFSGNDPDGNALSYTIVSQPSSGSVTKSGSTFTYTPVGSTTGTFSFSYQVSDGSLSSPSCTASITVTSCNTAPTCNAVSISTCQGVAVTGSFSGNDPNGDALTYSIVTAPNASTQGSVSINGSQFTFTPIATATGSISFTYKVTDSQGISSSNCTVSITINPKPLVTDYSTCETSYQLPTTGGITWSVGAGNTATVSSSGLITGMNFDGTYNFIANLGGCTTAITVTKNSCGCVKPDAGIDVSMCLPKTTTNLVDAPTGYQWIVSPSNPISTNINTSTGLVSGMTVTGTYQYILQKIGDVTCFDIVQVKVMPENPPIILCNDGTSSYKMVAPTYLSNVIWYNMAGQQVGVGASLLITSNTLGLADGTEYYYYKGDFGTPNVCECDVVLCCPVKITTRYCCPTPNCIDITIIK